ncbi:MAG: GAF domain-containing protein [Deltaproteobacteria bacterium]|nr:GAF domain-containing protein [Deltaproteobacteria bacterium]
MAKLILLTSEERAEFDLAAVNTIGRHPENTIQILDRIISKEHAHVLRTADNRFLLKDLGSLNGTFVGEDRVSERILKDGDEISLGASRLLFREDPGSAPPLSRVTIAPGMAQSHIRQRIAADTGQFRPEKEIAELEILRRDYERLRIAHELAQAVGAELDLDRLLRKILDKAFELLPADRGVIMLMNDQGVPVPHVTKHNNERAANEEIILSNSILSEVVREKQAVLSSDATVDSRFSGAHSIIMQGIRSTMCVPLLHGTELLGIMHLDSQFATNAFTEKDLQLFTGIATQAAIAIQNARLAHKIEWEARTRAQFQRFFSPGMVEQMVEGKLKLDSVGEAREVTIMFADIRGFTAMTENANAHDIVSVLNEYFETMVEVLFRHEGTLDKYVGDEIMALFGVPRANDEAACLAVECAVEMMSALKDFNRTRSTRNLPPLSIGIGINTGTCVYGAIGSSKTLQYTVIGDPVNTASRLCSLAGANEIIISEATYLQASHRIDALALPKARVKGKLKELSIYRVAGVRDGSWGPESTDPNMRGP